MKVNFIKDGGAGESPAPAISVETSTQQLTDVETRAAEAGPVGVVGGTGPVGDPGVGVPAVQTSPSIVTGDDLPGFKDVMFPRINIVQNLGELKNTFSPGEIVLGQQTVLFTPPVIDKKTGNASKPGTPPVNIVVLGITQKRFHEIVVGGMGGMIVGTEAEVRAAGGTLDYKEWELKKSAGMKRFGPMIDLLVAIRRPEHIVNDNTVFGFDVEGNQYALALWSMQKTSYTEGYKKVLAFNRLAGVLKGQFPNGGYPSHSFSLSTIEKPYPGAKLAHIPVLIPSTKSTPPFLGFVAQIICPAA